MKSLLDQTALILRNELRLKWRETQTGGARALFRSYGALIALQVLAHVVLTLITCLAPHPLSPAIEAGVWLFVALLISGGAMHQSLDLLFLRSDRDLLLSSPIPPRAVLLAKGATIAAAAAASGLLILIPAINASAIGFSPKYLAAYPTFLAITVVNTAIGIAATFGIVRLLGPRRGRVAVQVLGAIMGATVFIVTQSARMIPARWSEPLAIWIDALLSTPALQLLVQSGRGSLWPLVATAGAGLFAVLTAAVLLDGLLLRGVLDAAGTAARPKTAKPTQRSPTAPRGPRRISMIWFRKEARLILRDFSFLARALPTAFYILPAMFPMLRQSGSVMLPALGVIATSQFASIFARMSGNGEECWELIRTSPAALNQLRTAKAAAASAIALFPALLLGAIAAVLGHPGVALLGWFVAVVIGATCARLQVSHIKPTARADLLKRQSLREPITWRSLVQLILGVLGAAGMIAFASEFYRTSAVILAIAVGSAATTYLRVETSAHDLET